MTSWIDFEQATKKASQEKRGSGQFGTGPADDVARSSSYQQMQEKIDLGRVELPTIESQKGRESPLPSTSHPVEPEVSTSKGAAFPRGKELSKGREQRLTSHSVEPALSTSQGTALKRRKELSQGREVLLKLKAAGMTFDKNGQISVDGITWHGSDVTELATRLFKGSRKNGWLPWERNFLAFIRDHDLNEYMHNLSKPKESAQWWKLGPM